MEFELFVIMCESCKFPPKNRNVFDNAILNLYLLDGSDSGLNVELFDASVETLRQLAASIDADMVKLRERTAEKGKTGQFLIRKHIDTTDFMEIRYGLR